MADQSGYLAMREHFDRLAAENDRGRSVPPVRRHYDEVAALRFCGSDDGFVGALLLNVDRFASDTCSVCSISHGSERSRRGLMRG